jgi:uncharacterized membrane protein
VAVGIRQAKRQARGVARLPVRAPYHPMLVTHPIGAWVASLLLDIASHLASRALLLAMRSVLCLQERVAQESPH